MPNHQPIVQPDIRLHNGSSCLLHNRTRFLPRSKPLARTEVLLHEAIWLLHRHLQARACPGIARVISKHCVLISQGPDAKMRGVPSDQYKCAYTRTDVRIALQCSDNTLPQLRIKCGVAKFCPGTHSALQAPMGCCKNDV